MGHWDDWCKALINTRPSSSNRWAMCPPAAPTSAPPTDPIWDGLIGCLALADGLHRSLQTTTATSGVQLPSNNSITDLGYADDHALVSGSAAGLQHLIYTAAAWCSAVEMQPSPDKTICHGDDPGRSATAQLALRGDGPVMCFAGPVSGHRLPMRAQCLAHFQPFGAPHVGQPHFLHKRYNSLGCSNSIWLLGQLHAACVEPAGSFGSKLWGVYPQHARGRQRLEKACLATDPAALRPQLVSGPACCLKGAQPSILQPCLACTCSLLLEWVSF